jgi:hypothetical protein
LPVKSSILVQGSPLYLVGADQKGKILKNLKKLGSKRWLSFSLWISL